MTLAAILIGWLVARNHAKHERWQEDIGWWVDQLVAIHREILEAEQSTIRPTGMSTEELQAAARAINEKAFNDLLTLTQSRPTVRNSPADVLSMSIGLGILGGSEGGARAHLAVPLDDDSEIKVDWAAGVGLCKRVLVDTIELGQSWRYRGVSQNKVDVAMQTRMTQLGFTREADPRRTGPQAFHGGWT
ncbi:hypothetical protein [Gordonia sputi]